jgi:hypothetical protein
MALLLSACEKPPPEDPAAVAFQRTTTTLLMNTAALSYLDCIPIPDGGSMVFRFRTDTGAAVEILALHPEAASGPTERQEFLLQDPGGRQELRIKPGSPLDRKLIALLEGVPRGRARIRWLVARMKDGRLLWEDFPSEP